jgi:hypothetical protein
MVKCLDGIAGAGVSQAKNITKLTRSYEMS